MAHECSKCTFVANEESIFTGWASKAKAGKKPKLVGCFTLPNWTGHLRFYLFRCLACKMASVDYPHGYTSDGMRSGLLYFFCPYCESTNPLYDREIYESSGMPAPPSFWGVVKQMWFLRKRLKEGN